MEFRDEKGENNDVICCGGIGVKGITSVGHYDHLRRAKDLEIFCFTYFYFAHPSFAGK